MGYLESIELEMAEYHSFIFKCCTGRAQLPSGQESTVFGNQEGPHINPAIETTKPVRPTALIAVGQKFEIVNVDELPRNHPIRIEYRVEVERYLKWKRSQGVAN